jgi:hypothetical protein
MRVGLRVGPMRKSFDVVGTRVWQAGLTGIRRRLRAVTRGSPSPTTWPSAVRTATAKTKAEHDAYLRNPVGRGWHKHLKNEWVDGKPLPLTEESGEVVTSRTMRQVQADGVWACWARLAAAGALSRARTTSSGWTMSSRSCPRTSTSATTRRHPKTSNSLPEGPMEVVLSGFTPDGLRQFMLPHFEDAGAGVPQARRARGLWWRGSTRSLRAGPGALHHDLARGQAA